MKKLGLLLLLLASPAFAYKFVATQIVTNGNMASASVTSLGTEISQIQTGAIQAVFTGAPVGTLDVQASADIVAICAAPANPACNVTHWTSILSAPISISAAGNQMFNFSNAGYEWIQLVYTKTSGTGTLNANLDTKGMF